MPVNKKKILTKLGLGIKNASFILFLSLLLATVFGDGYNGRWVECMVSAVALGIIIKK